MTISHFALQNCKNEEVILPSYPRSHGLGFAAPLQTINFEKLRKNWGGEITRLLTAAQYPGFFYLELSEPIIQSVRRVYTSLQQTLDKCPGTTWSANNGNSLLSDAFADLKKLIVQEQPDLVESPERAFTDFRSLLDICSALQYTIARHLTLSVSTSAALHILSGNAAQHQQDIIKERSNFFATFPVLSTTKIIATTEIHVPGAGLGDDLDWAHVVPKNNCILIGVNGARWRRAELEADEQDEIWFEYEAR